MRTLTRHFILFDFVFKPLKPGKRITVLQSPRDWCLNIYLLFLSLGNGLMMAGITLLVDTLVLAKD